MWILLEPERLRVAVNVSLKELAVVQNDPQAEKDSVAMDAASEKHRAYLVSHLTVKAGEQTLAGQVSKVTPPLALGESEATFYQYEIDYPLGGARPAKVSVAHDMLREFPYGPGQAWDLSYTIRWKNADSQEITTALLSSRASAEFPTGWDAPSAESSAPAEVKVDGWRTFKEYCVHGIMHILTGYDHLLFVAALVLATVSFWEMVKVIAAFTLAHTITLALSVFDIFRLPAWIVEPVIAASIVFVALENILHPRRTHSWLRLGVAFGFGLIHGLGFAGGLMEAMEGLPHIGIWIALAAFSLGVEIGHQVVVLPLYGLLAAGRAGLQDRWTGKIVRAGSLLISLCGVYYLVLSVREQFFHS